MKTVPTLAAAAFVIAMAFSCKKMDSPNENVQTTESDAISSEQSSSDLKPVISSAAAVEKQDPKRKFVRTADIKFKVKNVAKSTYAIENAVTKFGGIVTNTNLQSHIDERYSTKISSDSTLETTKFTVENNLTLRIPNTKLDTVIKSIAKEVAYLDFRVIKADDVALKLLSNELAQNRNAKHSKRLENDVDVKGKKLNDINDVENNILSAQEQKDNATIENLSLEDQVSFSTVTLALYQKESLSQEIVAIEKTGSDYGNFGLEILDGIKTGWYVLERIIAFIVQLWSVALLAILGIFIYRRFGRKSKAVIL